MQEEQKQYEEKEKRHEDVPEKDADLDEDKTKKTEQEVKVEGESSKFLSWMRGLSPHHHPLKDRMRDKTFFYMDLLRPGHLPRNHPKNMQNGNRVDRQMIHCNTIL